MEDFQAEKKKSGVVRYHLNCIYHGDLGEQESEEKAREVALLHITTNHSDQAGNVAANAEVVIHAATHIRASDLATETKA